jgi:hypothetical protein
VFIIGSSKDERRKLLENFYEKQRKWSIGCGFEVKIHLITGLGDLDNKLQGCIPRMVFVREDLPEQDLVQIKGKVYARHPQLSVSFFGVKVIPLVAVDQPSA